MYLDRKDLEAMDLFGNKAEKLKKCSFIKQVTSGNFSMTISAGKGEPVKIDKRYPTGESIDAFVLTLRFFIQDNEPSSIRKMAEIYAKLPDYSLEKAEFQKTRKELNEYLDSPGKSLKIDENGKTLTSKEIRDVFLWGGLAHSNQRRKYDEWMTNPLLGPILQGEFIHTVTITLMCISHIQRLNDSLIVDFNHFKL